MDPIRLYDYHGYSRFTFHTRAGKKTIYCTLAYARLLVDTGRVRGGRFDDIAFRTYL